MNYSKMLGSLVDHECCLALCCHCVFQLYSDFVYGSCIDGFLKSQAGDCEPGDRDCPSVYMYLFTHRSEFEPLPFWMGENSENDTSCSCTACLQNGTCTLPLP